jgi:hypothetical protein
LGMIEAAASIAYLVPANRAGGADYSGFGKIAGWTNSSTR